MLQPGRNNSTSSFRFGFNGKEMDNEANNQTGTSYDYGARVLNPRLGRFLSVDPMHREYPYYSTFMFSADNPILYIDIDGLQPALGSPFYGNNIIFGTNKMVNSVNNTASNSAWHAHSITNLKDVKQRIQEYKQDGYLVKNVVLFTHGGNNRLGIVGDDIAGTDVSVTTQSTVTAESVNQYLKYKDLMKKPEANRGEVQKILNGGDGLNELRFDALRDLEEIFVQLEDGARVVFGSCLTGNCFSSDENDNLVKALGRLAPDKRLYFNMGTTNNPKDGVVLDRGLSGGDALGWKRIRKGITNILRGKDVVLDSDDASDPVKLGVPAKKKSGE